MKKKTTQFDIRALPRQNIEKKNMYTQSMCVRARVYNKSSELVHRLSLTIISIEVVLMCVCVSLFASEGGAIFVKFFPLLLVRFSVLVCIRSKIFPKNPTIVCLSSAQSLRDVHFARALSRNSENHVNFGVASRLLTIGNSPTNRRMNQELNRKPQFDQWKSSQCCGLY